MKTEFESIQLPNTDESVVKCAALMFFRALRTVTDYIAATQAASDIAAAWEESFRPKA